jgi:hypothetical protein
LAKLKAELAYELADVIVLAVAKAALAYTEALLATANPELAYELVAAAPDDKLAAANAPLA